MCGNAEEELVRIAQFYYVIFMSSIATKFESRQEPGGKVTCDRHRDLHCMTVLYHDVIERRRLTHRHQVSCQLYIIQ